MLVDGFAELNLIVTWSLSSLHMQAVGASVRIFALMDRQPEVVDGHHAFEDFKGGTHVHVHCSLPIISEP